MQEKRVLCADRSLSHREEAMSMTLKVAYPRVTNIERQQLWQKTFDSYKSNIFSTKYLWKIPIRRKNAEISICMNQKTLFPPHLHKPHIRLITNIKEHYLNSRYFDSSESDIISYEDNGVTHTLIDIKRQQQWPAEDASVVTVNQTTPSSTQK